MANKIYIRLEVDDKGTAVVRGFDKNTEQAFGKMRANADKASKSMGASLQKLKQHWLAVTAAMAGTVMAIGKIIKKHAEWEISLIDMKKVTTQSLDWIKQKIMALPPALGTATEMVKGYYQVISAGVKHPIKSMELLVTASKTAKAAHVSQAEAIKALTKLMAGYEGEIKNAAEAADLLFAIEKEGQTTVGELVPIIGSLAKLSHDLGVSQDELGASLALVTQTAGNTAEAATQYQGILMALMKPTEAMKDAVHAMGYESAQAAIQELGLAETLRRLQAQTGGSAEKMAELFQRVEGLKGMSALGANEFSKLADKVEALSQKTGSGAQAWDDYKKSSVSSWDELKASMEKAAIFLGDILSPAVKEWAGYISDAVEYWTKFLNLRSGTIIDTLKDQRAALQKRIEALRTNMSHDSAFADMLKMQGVNVNEVTDQYKAQIEVLQKRIALIDKSIAEEQRLAAERDKGGDGGGGGGGDGNGGGIGGGGGIDPAVMKEIAEMGKGVEEAWAGVNRQAAEYGELVMMDYNWAEEAWEKEKALLAEKEEFLAAGRQAQLAAEWQLYEDIEEGVAKSFKSIEQKHQTMTDNLKNAVAGWASNFSAQLNDMLWNAETTFKDILRAFARMVTQMLIQAYVVKPLLAMMGIPLAKGGVIDQSRLLPYARGGIVDKPTMFPMAGGMGLMGEKGPEAVMPLARTSSGDLGVKTAGEPRGKGDVYIIMENPTFQDQATQRQVMANIATQIAERVAPGAVVRSYDNDGPIRARVRSRI